jgi:hypothetical protein
MLASSTLIPCPSCHKYFPRDSLLRHRQIKHKRIHDHHFDIHKIEDDINHDNSNLWEGEEDVIMDDIEREEDEFMDDMNDAPEFGEVEALQGMNDMDNVSGFGVVEGFGVGDSNGVYSDTLFHESSQEDSIIQWKNVVYDDAGNLSSTYII